MNLIEDARWIRSQLVERTKMLRGGLAVLMYHRVCPEEDHRFLQDQGVPRVSPEIFGQQLQFLREHDFRIFSFREALELLARRRRFPPRSVLITFDDGFRDNLTAAAPLLREQGWPATIFVATDGLARSELLWEHRLFCAVDRLGEEQTRELADRHLPADRRASANWLDLTLYGLTLEARDRLGEEVARQLAEEGLDESVLARELYLAPEELLELDGQGIEIASHGAAHHPYTALFVDEKCRDLDRAHRALKEILGERVLPVFSSPYGSHRRGDRPLLTKRGYQAATSVKFGTNGRRTDRFFLRRISLGDRSWHRLRFLDRSASVAARIDGIL